MTRLEKEFKKQQKRLKEGIRYYQNKGYISDIKFEKPENLSWKFVNQLKKIKPKQLYKDELFINFREGYVEQDYIKRKTIQQNFLEDYKESIKELPEILYSDLVYTIENLVATIGLEKTYTILMDIPTIFEIFEDRFIPSKEKFMKFKSNLIKALPHNIDENFLEEILENW